MEKTIDKITDSELEVMNVLWAEKEPLPLSTIRQQLQKKTGWEPATIKTLLSRLVTKQAVKQEKREVFYYSALVRKKDYDRWATGALIRKLYNGSAKNLVAALLNAEELTQNDIDELRQMFQEEK